MHRAKNGRLFLLLGDVLLAHFVYSGVKKSLSFYWTEYVKLVSILFSGTWFLAFDCIYLIVLNSVPTQQSIYGSLPLVLAHSSMSWIELWVMYWDQEWHFDERNGAIIWCMMACIDHLFVVGVTDMMMPCYISNYWCWM